MREKTEPRADRAQAEGALIVLGAGFAWYLSRSQALIQRVAAEHARGRVTGVVGMLQESAALVCSAGITALGGLVLIQPFLVGSAVLLTVAGLWGIRAGARHRRIVRTAFVDEAGTR